MTRTTSDPARFSKSALFRLLKYEPHAGQLLVHRSRAARRVLACGSRFGKSTAAAYEAIAAMLEPRERSIGWIVAPTHDLADRVFRLVVEVVQTHFKHRIRTLSERDQRIVLTNFGGGTSEVRGKSADRPSSLLGEGLDWLVVDEAAQLDQEIWNQYLSQRLVDRNGWALFVSSPKGGGWFYKMYRRGQPGKDAAYESWSLPSITNPHLDAAAIEAERARLPDDIYRQEYLGEFINTYAEPCEICGGPRHGARGIIIMEDESDPPRCPECNLAVDENGQTVVAIWPDGSLRFEIIREVGIAWPLDAPDELISPETRAKDDAARLGPHVWPRLELLPEEVELAKAGIPMKDWPESTPTAPKPFVPGPLRSTADYDE